VRVDPPRGDACCDRDHKIGILPERALVAREREEEGVRVWDDLRHEGERGSEGDEDACEGGAADVENAHTEAL
jgi:hypothetical protein